MATNVFFSRIAPETDDIAELKAVLHIFYLLYQKKGYPRYVSEAELLGDAPGAHGHNGLEDGRLVVAVAVREPDENGGHPVRLIDIRGLDPVQGRFDELGHLVDRDPEPAESLPVEPDDELVGLLQCGLDRRFDKIKDYLVSVVAKGTQRLRDKASAESAAPERRTAGESKDAAADERDANALLEALSDISNAEDCAL